MIGTVKDFTEALTQLEARGNCCAVFILSDLDQKRLDQNGLKENGLKENGLKENGLDSATDIASAFDRFLSLAEEAGLPTSLAAVFSLEGQKVPAEVLLITKLKSNLKSDDAERRRQAADSLGAMENEGREALSELMEALDDAVAPVREAAAKALGRLEAIPELMNALKDSQNRVLRQSAAWALGQIGAPARESIPALIDTLRDGDDGVRKAAAWALERIFTDDKNPMPPRKTTRRSASTSRENHRSTPVVAKRSRASKARVTWRVIKSYDASRAALEGSRNGADTSEAKL